MAAFGLSKKDQSILSLIALKVLNINSNTFDNPVIMNLKAPNKALKGLMSSALNDSFTFTTISFSFLNIPKKNPNTGNFFAISSTLSNKYSKTFAKISVFFTAFLTTVILSPILPRPLNKLVTAVFVFSKKLLRNGILLTITFNG